MLDTAAIGKPLAAGHTLNAAVAGNLGRSASILVAHVSDLDLSQKHVADWSAVPGMSDDAVGYTVPKKMYAASLVAAAAPRMDAKEPGADRETR